MMNYEIKSGKSRKPKPKEQDVPKAHAMSLLATIEDGLRLGVDIGGALPMLRDYISATEETLADKESAIKTQAQTIKQLQDLLTSAWTQKG